jgi:hypothetical protein
MSTPITPYPTSPTLSVAYQEGDFVIPEGVAFSALQETPEPWSPPQAQVVTYPWHSHYAKQHYEPPAHGLPICYSGYHPDSPITETPTQSEQDMEDCKYPPDVLEQMDNTQLSTGPAIYLDHTPGLRFRQGQLESGMNGFHQKVDKQSDKMNTQAEEIEKLKEMVYELKGKMEDQEKKLKAQEKKLKGHEYRIGKRYHTRSGKK